MSHDVGFKKCSAEGCEAAFKNHGWGSTKAHKAGWFHQKDGTSWCPAHTPDWVTEWRDRKKRLTSK